MRNLLIASIVSSLLAGCGATIELKSPPQNPSVKLRLADNRKAEEKTYFRDGVTSPVQLFGDEDFTPPPVSQFSKLLESRLPAGSHELEVAQFRVIDMFPQRLSAATSAALTGALGSLGYSVFFSDSQTISTQDNISCVIAGRLNYKAIQAKASVPYKISPFAGLVKNDPSFKEAANKCLEQLSQSVANTVTQ